MKTNRIAIIAIALWFITVSVAAYFFIKGSTHTSSDQRLSVNLSPSEKNMVLGEMRTILQSVNGILNATANKDPKTAALAAKNAGMGMAVDATPALMAKLPIDFKSLGMSLHKDFDILAEDIEKGLTENQILQRLGQITNKCVACHSQYRLSSE